MLYLGKIILTALTAAAFSTEPIRVEVWHEGYAARYDPGVMEMVARNRKMTLEGCGVAIDGPSLGSFIEVIGSRTGVRRRCKVTDVSHPRDRARHVRAGLIELRHEDARAVCGRHWRSRWKECPIKWARVP